MSANASQARSTSGRHQRCCCRQCWSKIRCRRCAARKLALRGRPAQERNVEHRAWQDDPASLCARRRLVGCPKNRQEKLIGSRRTARQRHESSSAVVHVVTQKTPVISRSVFGGGFSARRGRSEAIQGAFERHSALPKRVRHERRCWRRYSRRRRRKLRSAHAEARPEGAQEVVSTQQRIARLIVGGQG